MDALPLTVLIGPEDELVVWEGEALAGLHRFILDTMDSTGSEMPLRTVFTCSGCFPRKSGQRVTNLIKYPLRIYADDDLQHLRVSYGGRPISHLGGLYISLSATQKRIVRITSYIPFPEDLRVALLDLGVEIIVEPPDQSAGAIDASL